MAEQLMSLAAVTDDDDPPREGMQYAVVVDGKAPQIYGDQSWVAGGKAAEELGGRTVRRSVTVTYGEWEPFPPPMAEPPNKSVVAVGSHVFQRDDDEAMTRWWLAGAHSSYTWKDVCEMGTPVLLAPVPESVELPREGIVGSPWPLRIRQSGFIGNVWVSTGEDARGTHLSPDQARQAAAALLSAADEAEREQ